MILQYLYSRKLRESKKEVIRREAEAQGKIIYKKTAPIRRRF